MKRRIIALSLTAICLLTSCKKVPSLRSDIAKFVASFSLNEARKVYLESGYYRQDISYEKEKTVRAYKSLVFNIKDLANISYSYSYRIYDDTVLRTESWCYVEKENDHYLVYETDKQTVAKTAEEVVKQYVSNFFFTASLEDVHQGGMYVGDTLLSVINEIQDCVTIDEENKLLVYDKPSTIKDTPLEFDQHMVVDELGMLVSSEANSTNGDVTMKTIITVFNNQ